MAKKDFNVRGKVTKPETAMLEQFRDAIRSTGLQPPDVIEADGKLRRFASNGQRGDDAGWYVLHSDGIPAGCFGDWRTALSQTWRADIGRKLSAAEEAAHRKRMDQIRRERETEEERRHAEAANKAAGILQAANGDPASHPYAVRKAVPLGPAVERGPWPQRGWIDALLVPVYGIDDKVLTVEAINANGDKDFLRGGKKCGAFHPFGDIRRAAKILIGEGLATVAAACQATGLAGIGAMDAGNLEHAARVVKEVAPSAEFVFVADNDITPEGKNSGIKAATEAARAVGGKIAIPDLDGKKCDFWDLFHERGVGAVKRAIEDAKSPEQKIDDSIEVTLQASGLAALGTDANMTAVEEAVRNLASILAHADEIRLATVREAALRKLDEIGIKAPARLLNAALQIPKTSTKNGPGQTLLLADPEPWPSPVDIGELLNDTTALIHRYVILSSESAHAVALWLLHAWALDAFDISPLLSITSPTKRCGKTTLLEIVGMLAPRAVSASNITAASLFRAIEKFNPVLLIDEADTFIGGDDELRGVINSGHRRTSAFVVRTVGDEHEPKAFSTWGAKALAAIGRLSSTLEDRSILLSMRRRAPGEQVERFRAAVCRASAEPLRRKAFRWASDAVTALREIESEVPYALHDRAADNWQPLLAISDLAGGDWPGRARTAAVSLSQDIDEAEGSALVELLLEVREIFQSKDRITSGDLAEYLGNKIETRWAEWRHGKPITQRQVARLLAPLKIKPATIRIGPETAKGYLQEAFSDAFSRYLPNSIRHTVTCKQDQSLTPEIDPSQNGDVTDRKVQLTPRTLRDVTDVTDRKQETAGVDSAYPSQSDWEDVF